MELTPAQKIVARCQEMVVRAQELYGMDLQQVRVSFDLKGRAAGKAGGRGYRLAAAAYYVKFNRDMLTREAFDHVHDDTVPHEYAHVICFMNPALGKNHDSGWAAVCRAMGGSGARTHKEQVVYGKGTTYEYTTCRGHKVRMGDARHREVQQGATLRYKRGLGTVSVLSAYSIVGVQGRTLAAPVVKQAPNSAASIEAAVPESRAATKEVPVHTLVPAAIIRARAPAARNDAGTSKAAVSRMIMQQGYRDGHSYETIITAMIATNGYGRQLARATFKANASRAGIPESFA
jgi:predicted SprT family Zn-dependent metalloprotease